MIKKIMLLNLYYKSKKSTQRIEYFFILIRCLLLWDDFAGSIQDTNIIFR
jgi:hypothetical protein